MFVLPRQRGGSPVARLHAGLAAPPVIPGATAQPAAPPAVAKPPTAEELAAALGSALIMRRLGIPSGSRPFALRGTWREATEDSSDLSQSLVSWRVPPATRFLVDTRISVLSLIGTVSGITGGLVIEGDAGAIFDGANGSTDWITQNGVTTGEWLDATDLQVPCPLQFDPGQVVALRAVVRKGGVSCQVAVHGALLGVLVSA